MRGRPVSINCPYLKYAITYYRSEHSFLRGDRTVSVFLNHYIIHPAVFVARDIDIAILSVRPSVRPSVCPSRSGIR